MKAAVAIPAKNEAARIGACLAALRAQEGAPEFAVVVVVNNTVDATAAIARGMGALVVAHDFAPAVACAGAARRMAMERAAGLLAADGVLLTTDADGCVPPDWVAANLREIGLGVDAVAGRAVLDPADAATIPARLRDDDAIECAYAAALDEIRSVLAPSAWDPWPRHQEHSGASIAVRLAAYRAVGGMPAAPLGEDRQFLAALAASGYRVRHAPGVKVVVSGRIVGRAAGGMADTIRRRLRAPDPYLDDALEPVADFVARLRGEMRPRRLVRAADAMAELERARRQLAGLISAAVEP